jgi:hypothetical protein
MTKNSKKYFDQKHAIFLFLGLHEGLSSCQKRNFFTFFLFWGSFCLPGSGSTVPIESGYNPDPDPDPKQWLKYYPAF